MHISLFDLFSIGIGPSSSHTVGPMRAAKQFVEQLINIQAKPSRVMIELYGSLALTGVGHGTDRAVLMGLCGETPESIDPDTIETKLARIRDEQTLSLNGQLPIVFNPLIDVVFHMKERLAYHTNGLRFTALTADQHILLQEIYYSIGGGFIVNEKEIAHPKTIDLTPPYPFDTATELLAHCHRENLPIHAIMLANEKAFRSEEEIKKRVLLIASLMEACINKGCITPGTLPGGLKVKRRAPDLYLKLTQNQPQHEPSHGDIMNWVNLFAMAVNEENAAGGRVVTAPTNGAAGIVPAVLQYYKKFCGPVTDDAMIAYLLTAAAIASLYKKGASISGAEVGCQGEVGVASSMAAGALTAILGGTVLQVENAAEIAMEHHLGMTCDPVMGLVQIPCIERNAMGSVKAINAARLALMEDGTHKVSLDKVIATMRQTGRDMMSIYKETSEGGLAVNIIEC